MNKRRIKESDTAVVGIIVTVLLIGLIMAFMVMINTVYVPQWIEESEASHMDQVSNQFSQLKYALDIQSLVDDSTAMTTAVTLGNERIPFFYEGRSYDYLEILDGSFGMQITTNESAQIYDYETDIIQYSSGNLHFVDQTYIYEGGALILRQESSNVLLGMPQFIHEGELGSNNLSFTFVDVEGMSGKNYISGYGSYPIYTKNTGPFKPYVELENITSITLFTQNTNAWQIVFNQTLREALGVGAQSIGYDYQVNDGRLKITFTPNEMGYYPHLKIREVSISAQIAFGLV